MALTNKLKAIADAIRGKTGKTEEMTLDQMATEIAGIQSGGGISEQDILDALMCNQWPAGDVLITGGNKGVTFAENKYITTVTFRVTNAHYILSARCFANNTALKSVLDGGVTYYSSNNVFTGCTALEEYVMERDSCTTALDTQLFNGCTALRYFDGSVNFAIINNKAFEGCTALKTIVLRRTSAPVTLVANAFTNSSLAEGGTGCTIYVPAALIEQYPIETNWSVWDAYGTITWKSIEGSEYE